MAMAIRLAQAGSTKVHRYRVPIKMPTTCIPTGVISGRLSGRKRKPIMIARPMIEWMMVLFFVFSTVTLDTTLLPLIRYFC